MQFHEMYMDKIHNHEVAGSIPAPATEDRLLIEGLGRFLSLKSFLFSSKTTIIWRKRTKNVVLLAAINKNLYLCPN